MGQVAAVRWTRAEMETLYRYDEDEKVLWMHTANVAVMRRWTRLGYAPMVLSRDGSGAPCVWSARGPVAALRLRRVRDGQLVKRQTKPPVAA